MTSSLSNQVQNIAQIHPEPLPEQSVADPERDIDLYTQIKVRVSQLFQAILTSTQTVEHSKACGRCILVLFETNKDVNSQTMQAIITAVFQDVQAEQAQQNNYFTTIFQNSLYEEEKRNCVNLVSPDHYIKREIAHLYKAIYLESDIHFTQQTCIDRIKDVYHRNRAIIPKEAFGGYIEDALREVLYKADVVLKPDSYIKLRHPLQQVVAEITGKSNNKEPSKSGCPCTIL